jgi:glycosyltransferase involved in cell wall biosynthesis
MRGARPVILCLLAALALSGSMRTFMCLILRLKPAVLHCHGAKAGAFIRLNPRSKDTIRVYTPHGGSLRYPLNALKGAFYSRLERALMNSTDLLLFESAFARDTYQRTIGIPRGLVRCVFNGVTADEFDPIVKAADATDVVYVGEFRHAKGADLLIDAVARLHAKPVTLTLAGNGEELGNLKAQVQWLGLTEAARFVGHVKARYGVSKGSLLVVPSRGDSMPLCRDRGGRGGSSDGGRLCRRHSGNLRFPCRRAVCVQYRRGDGGRDRDRARGSCCRAGARKVHLRTNLPAFLQKAMVEGVLAGYRNAFAER